MKQIIAQAKEKMFDKRIDFRLRLFNVTATAGVIISLLIAGLGVVIGAGAWNVLLNLSAAVIACGLIIYTNRSKRYQLGYMLTIVLVFLILFPLLFFSAGGYHSGMPSFFIFAVLFTVIMLDGKNLFKVAALEILAYIAVSVYAYLNPQSVTLLQPEFALLMDITVGFSLVSIVIGVTLFIHFRLYNEQQRELEAARQEALRLSKAKSAFLANMSHEIRTPISVMLGRNELILRESGQEQITDYARSIQNAGKTLLSLIDNILDMSIIESGKVHFACAEYKTSDLIGELSMIGAGQVSENGIRFQVEADECLPRELTGDFIHINQIVINFLSNAAKYTKQGCVTLRFNGKPGTSSDEILLCISVSDTGVGIKEEDIGMLFDTFTRVDLPAYRNIEGTGLGLAIAKELAERMGGRISVESEWGKGSVFTLELPQMVQDKTPLGKRLSSDTEKEYATGGFIAPGGSILVVDDNSENLQVVKSLLGRTMMRIDAAKSGEECLELVKNNRYNIILMDYMMHGMDGAEVLRRLRETPGFNTPVIALTANVVAGVKEKLLDAGFSAYLSKPVTWKDLEGVIIDRLPPELVTLHAARSGNLLTGDMRVSFARELAAYGVTLEDGLRYLSGDILQYRKMATFFIQNYEPGKCQLEELAAANDWNNLRFAAHSFKSKARAVGANSLSDTSTRLEKQCAESNGAYIAVTLPVLFYEWERARDGLVAFTPRLDGFIPEISAERDTNETIDSLLLLLKHNRQPDALVALDRMIALESSFQMTDRLRDIWQKIDDIELREAERLLLQLKEDSAYGS